MDFKNLTKESLPKEFQERIERLFIEAGTFEENDLFGYEMGCIKQALSFTEFFKEMSLEECKAFYEKYPSLFEAIKDKLPYFDNGHSGNSVSWMLYRCYKEKPELVPYMHGCLAQLVGTRAIMITVLMFQNHECNTTSLFSWLFYLHKEN